MHSLKKTILENETCREETIREYEGTHQVHKESHRGELQAER